MSKRKKLQEKLLGMYKGRISGEEVDLIAMIIIASDEYDVEKEISEFIDSKLDTKKTPEDQIQDIILYLETLIPPLEIVDYDFEGEEFDD